MAPVVGPLSTLGVPVPVKTGPPRIHHVDSEWQTLSDDDARVERDFAPAVAAGVVVAIENLLGVDGHCDGCLRRDVPSVEKPFHGEFEVLDDGVDRKSVV